MISLQKGFHQIEIRLGIRKKQKNFHFVALFEKAAEIDVKESRNFPLE